MKHQLVKFLRADNEVEIVGLGKKKIAKTHKAKNNRKNRNYG